MPEISTTQAVAEDTSLLHTTAPGPVLYTVHRQHTEGIFLDELAVGEDEQGSCYCAEPCIHWGNIAGWDEVDPADITPLISGDSPIITVPALEDEGVAEAASEDGQNDEETEDVSQILRDVIADL